MRRSLILVASLPLAATMACVFPVDDERTADSDTEGATSSTMASTGAGVDESGSGDSGAPPLDCQEDRPVPPAPIDCTGVDGVLDGDVVIEMGGDPITILDGVQTLNGSLHISMSAETSLDALACLGTVTGDLVISDNAALTDVGGLYSITTLGGDLMVSNNGALVDFDGVPNLEEADGSIIFEANASLASITGFHRLIGIGGDLTIQGNPALGSVDGLGGLRVVGGVLSIVGNAMLCVSSVDCVGEGIIMPAVPPDTWSVQDNDPGC